VDCVEKTKLYPKYDKEKVNLYVSSFFVLLSSIAQGIGMFFGSFAADAIGYTWAFISLGITLIAYACIYAVSCGTGGNIDDELLESGAGKKEDGHLID